MKKNKKLHITVTGNQYTFGIKIPRIKTYTRDTTGSRLDIRRKESEAIHSFMKEYNIGQCKATTIVED